MPYTHLLILLAAAALVAALAAPASGQEKPQVRDTNTHHLFTPPVSLDQWEARAAELRRQILFSAGLHPMPEKSPLNPRTTGRIEMEDIIIERVAIETLPGFYLAGNICRPRHGNGPFPAVANPHGHTSEGRLAMMPDVPPADPPPAPPAPGRNNLVAIGVHLARQGFVVFAYDMTGYNDTSQLGPHRQTFDNLESWVNGASLMGLQLWNSIRAVDFLQSLPYVDKDRIGATGGSGGGSQTFLLSAVDDRVKAAAPVNMVSSYMQGGCLCENGPALRIGTDNAEIAALTAPRALLLVSATGDWTAHTPDEEWPAIREIYSLYGAEDHTDIQQFNYEHNYNIESREAVYRWFARWLQKDTPPETTREKPFQLDPQKLLVWDKENPLPEDALDQHQMLDYLRTRNAAHLRRLMPRSPRDWQRFQQTFRPALALSLGMSTLPPPAAEAKGAAAILVVSVSGDPRGRELVEALRGKDIQTSTLELPSVEVTEDELWRDFYSCYNPTPLAERTQEVTNRLLQLQEQHPEVHLVGLGEAGLWSMLARAISPGRGMLIADGMRINPSSDADYLPSRYAPGLLMAGGFQAAALLTSSQGLVLHNTGDTSNWQPVVESYQKSGRDITLRGERMMVQEIARMLTR